MDKKDNKEKKLVSTKTLIHLLEKIVDPGFRQLNQKFQSRDPENYGSIEQDDFRDILWEIEPKIGGEDFDEIERESGIDDNGRVDYLTFLKNLEYVNNQYRKEKCHNDSTNCTSCCTVDA